MTTIEQRLENIETLLLALVQREQVRESYSVEEFSRIVGRAPLTVREWARNKRVHASKKESGRGAHKNWALSHGELLRFQREGLLPVQEHA